MDDDYDDYSYYRKPQLRLASVVKAEDENEEVSQAVKAMHGGIGVAFLALGLCTSDVLQFFLFWLALAVAIAPFAPRHITGGDCRVGQGPEVEFDPDLSEDEAQKERRSFFLSIFPSTNKAAQDPDDALSDTAEPGSKKAGTKKSGSESKPAGEISNSAGWTRAEWDKLRGLLVKFPRGTPQRWETITKNLGGRKATAEVIAAAKYMQESTDKDPYAGFLASRGGSLADEPASIVGVAPTEASEKDVTAQSASAAVASAVAAPSVAWTQAQEKALLQALKDIPKDAAQRWDKIAGVVPGRSKEECQQRLAEMRQNLRSKKAEKAGEDSL